MHIISAADFPVFCSNSARKCLNMPAEYSPQKSLIIIPKFVLKPGVIFSVTVISQAF